MVLVLGHIKPLLFNFKGGKGVATFFGTMAALSLHLFLVLILCTVVIAVIIKSLTIGFYSSLPLITFLNYIETRSFIILIIFILIVSLVSVVGVKDIEQAFEKYFRTPVKKRPTVKKKPAR